ncbi:MAG: Holliday junction resolvase RuvX [Rhodobacteraceae bacterium]|nr:MAG: Holliday junction resolvase RuvX [Paracoccaceae bacterium]
MVEGPTALGPWLAPGRPLVGLDLGTKTIGVAVSDTRRSLATPLETLKRGKFAADAAALGALAAGRDACGFVLGLPRNMDGSEGPRAQASRAFARNLSRALGLPIALWDERLSTVAVEKALIAADSSRKRRAEVVDRMAAAHILQGALDRLAWAARSIEGEGGHG